MVWNLYLYKCTYISEIHFMYVETSVFYDFIYMHRSFNMSTFDFQQGKSVVVDSTNPDKESRARWTSLAKSMNVQCRCARMMTTKAHALHNNKFREIMKMKHILVNEIIINTYKLVLLYILYLLYLTRKTGQRFLFKMRRKKVLKYFLA